MASRLVERVALGDLTQVYPPDEVDQVLLEGGIGDRRVRLLPARLMTYFLLGRALFCPDPYREVLRKLAEGARRDGHGWQGWHIPDKAAISRARHRLSSEAMRELFLQGAGWLATEVTPGAWWRGRRLMALDGTTMEAADTPANRDHLGGPRPRLRGQGPIGYPAARLVVLIETGTHAIVDARAGPWRIGERALAESLTARMSAGMLVLADRGFPGVRLWKMMADTGADLLWRVSGLWKLPPEQVLEDGSWISTARHDCGPRKDRQAVRVRVIEYVLDDPGRDRAERYRLITTILNPADGPADELAALYAERWEAEIALKELKTIQIGFRHVLPSKSPALVFQEIYAHLAVYAAIRRLMHRIAVSGDNPCDPDRLSFTAALRAVRRSISRPASDQAGLLTHDPLADFANEVLHELNPPRRLRSVIRQIKRKLIRYVGWDPKRPRPLQPTKQPLAAVKILPATPIGPDP